MLFGSIRNNGKEPGGKINLAASNLVPKVLSYPPYGARERERGRVGENPGNEVALPPNKKSYIETGVGWVGASSVLDNARWVGKISIRKPETVHLTELQKKKLNET